MEAQRGSVNCSKLYVLWWTQDLDMDTRVHVIKHWQCCLHVHQDTHAASKLASCFYSCLHTIYFIHTAATVVFLKHAPVFTSLLEGSHIALGMKYKLL